MLDEGHAIRNPTSKLAAAAKRIVAQHRVILSGTLPPPVQPQQHQQQQAQLWVHQVQQQQAQQQQAQQQQQARVYMLLLCARPPQPIPSPTVPCRRTPLLIDPCIRE